MNKIVVIKTGSALPALKSRQGDFEDWIVAGMGVPEVRISVVDVAHGGRLPEYPEVCGAVITGSSELVTERRGWSERTAEWLQGAVDKGFPILGICYGHQLLAQALGGEVDFNPRGMEYGTVTVYMTDDGRADPLLGGFGSLIRVQVTHAQSVTRLPEGARVLAWSDADPNSAFALAETVWGVQFHPEFDARIVQEYVRHHREELRREGRDPDGIIARISDTAYGAEILRRFSRLALTGRESLSRAG